MADLVAVLNRFTDTVVLLRPFHEMNGPWFWWGHDVTVPRTALIDRSLDTYPTAIFAHSWYSWTDTQTRALVEQPDITWALNQPQILTLEGVNW